MLTASVIAALVPSMLVVSGSTPAAAAGCAVVDSIGRCLVSAVDPGRPGADRSSPGRRRTEPRIRPNREEPADSSDSDPPQQPSPPSVRALPIGTGWAARSDGDLDRLLTEPAAGNSGQPAEQPSPEILAARAVRQLDLPAPTIRTSSDRGAVVGVPVWLWIDPDVRSNGRRSATATAGDAQVTVEARFSGLEWSMGPPGAIVRCNGTGTPWNGQEGPSPDCGYTYRERSLDDRTSGAGKWTVVATAVWSVTWTGFSAGAPVTGQQQLRIPSTTTLPVGEIQVLVDGEGS